MGFSRTTPLGPDLSQQAKMPRFTGRSGDENRRGGSIPDLAFQDVVRCKETEEIDGIGRYEPRIVANYSTMR